MAASANLTRRAALGVMGAGALGYAIFGPRGAKQRSDGRLVLDYWEKWTQVEGDAMREVVRRFNESQDRLWVRYFSTGTIDQKAMIAIAGNDPPDILGLANFSIPAYAESNAILPLDELAAKANIRREDYAPAIWPMLSHQGKLWAIVNTCGSLAMYYNLAAFREAGLDPDRPPRTTDELDEAHRKLCLFRSKTGSVSTADGPDCDIERAGFLHTEPDWWRWHWGYYFGGTLYDQPNDRATAALPENIRAYQWMQTYPRALDPKRVTKFQTGFGFYGTPEHPFLQGKVVMTNQGPWLANIIRQFKPDLDYGVAPFPVEKSIYDPKQPIGLLDGDVLVVPRGAKHPEASFEFIAFTQRPENVEYLSSIHGKNSPLVKQSEQFEKNHVNKYVRVHSEIANSPRAFIFPRTRTWQEYVAEFKAGQQAMWLLQTEPEPALKQIEFAAQKQLDRAASARRKRGEI